MLRLVIPISHADSGSALKLLSHLSGEGDSAKGLPVTLVLSKSLAAEADKFLDAAKKVSEDAEVKVLESEDDRGWPWSANHLFRSAVQHLCDTGNVFPWIWLEADSTPLTRDWAMRIATEYNLQRKPYLGTSRPSILRDKDGVERGTDGEHLIGVAVYPHDFYKRSLLWRYVADGPFDVYCRWEIRPAAHVSDLIAHDWKARNFRGDREKGLVWDGEDQTPIPAKSVLHHGCKDGSLLEAIWKTPAPEKPAGEKPKLPKITLAEEEE